MISLAPMVDRTDRYFRYLCRILSKETLLYTEMITCQALIHGDLDKLLAFHNYESPVALQIAGTQADDVYKAVKLAESYPFTEVNLNVGCPSDRVSGNEMGACLMAYPHRVKEMVLAMKEATKKKVTVKHRIGIDGTGILPLDHKQIWDTYEDLYKFVEIMDSVRIDSLIIHARIAILAGLSPKENREIPPLRYGDIYRLKEDFPHIPMWINGGITTCDQVDEHLKHMDGVMIGRKFYDDPYFLSVLDRHLGFDNRITRRRAIEQLIPYIEEMESMGHKNYHILTHAINLFHGKRGSKIWKQLLSPQNLRMRSTANVLNEALNTLPSHSLDALD